MRPTLFSKLLLVGFLAGAYQAVLAHEQGGALAAPTTSKARWRINCLDDGNGIPSDLFFTVRAATRSRTFGITATVSKEGQMIAVTDNKSSDSSPSAPGQLTQGPGDYFVEINKSKAIKGTMIYSLTYHCQASNGAHTGTEIFRAP